MKIISTFYEKLPQVVVFVTGLTIVFAYGIYYSLSSPLIPKLQSREFPLHVTLEDISLFVTVGMVGRIIGCLTYPIFTYRIGRKHALLFLTPLYIFCFLFVYFADQALTFLHIGEFIGGFAEALVYPIFAIYICEICEPEIRGIMICFSRAVFYGGCIFINLVGAYCSIQTTCLIAIGINVIFAITFSLVPQSPYYLLMKNKVEEAKKSLGKLRRDKNIDAELDQMQKDVLRQMSEKGTWKDLFLSSSSGKAFLIGNVLTFLEIFSAHGPLTIFAQSFFAESTTFISEELAASLVLLLGIPFIFISTFLVDFVGRRPLMLTSIGGNIISLSLLSMYFFVKDFYWPKISHYSWIVFTVIVVYNGFHNIGLAPLTLSYKSELLPLKIKGTGQLGFSLIYSLSLFASAELYQSLVNYHSTAWPLLIFTVIQIGGFVFCFLYLPETKGKTLEEIQQQLKRSRT